MPITLTASTTANGVSISAPTSSPRLDTYLSTNPGIAVSIPIAGTGISLTGMGRYTSNDSVWRIRNGGSTALDATLTANGGGFSGEFAGLPSGTDTFVLSSVFKTHILQAPGIYQTKAAGTQTFKYGFILSNTDQYTLNGSNGNDTLTGADSTDTLIGKGGDDTLTGGLGGDRFVFTNQGTDTITDFSATDNDVFAITSAAYGGVSTTNIIINTLADIKALSGVSERFAYATDTNQLLYDGDNDWSTIDTVVANASVTGTISASNFAFV